MKKTRRRLHLWVQEKLGRSTEFFEPHGVPVFIPEDGDVDLRYKLSRKHPYEEPEALMIREFIQPNTNVVELGGCYGIISALIRRIVGPDAKHVIVELNKELVDVCFRNAANEANDGATEIVNAAIDYSGNATVEFSTGKNAHAGHVARNGEAGQSIGTTTLTQISDMMPDGPFALVCDIEGAEIEMFNSEEAVFSRIHTIILETHPRVYSSDKLKALEDRIAQLGYTKKMSKNNVDCYSRTEHS